MSKAAREAAARIIREDGEAWSIHSARSEQEAVVAKLIDAALAPERTAAKRLRDAALELLRRVVHWDDVSIAASATEKEIADYDRVTKEE